MDARKRESIISPSSNQRVATPALRPITPRWKLIDRFMKTDLYGLTYATDTENTSTTRATQASDQMDCLGMSEDIARTRANNIGDAERNLKSQPPLTPSLRDP